MGVALVAYLQCGRNAVGHVQRGHILELFLLAIHNGGVGFQLAHGPCVNVAQALEFHLVGIAGYLDALHLI